MINRFNKGYHIARPHAVFVGKENKGTCKFYRTDLLHVHPRDSASNNQIVPTRHICDVREARTSSPTVPIHGNNCTIERSDWSEWLLVGDQHHFLPVW